MKTVKFISVALAALVMAACQPRYVKLGGYAQGGVWAVCYNAAGVTMSPAEMQAAVDSILNTIDTTLSGYNSKSRLSRFNRGELRDTDSLFRTALKMAEHYFEMTDGAVDAGAGPLFDIWGFGFSTDSLPDKAAVDSALLLSREWKVLNFNSFAQGFSCDLVADFLKSKGVADMLVDIGEIYCCGVNPDGAGWKVGIDNPVDGNDNPGADLHGIWSSGGRACGLVTSGNYRKYYVVDGVKYSHTIDPRTGYPVSHSLLSATVVAPTSAEADALATFFMVAGYEEARRYVESRPDIEAYLICSDCEWASPGFTLN